jgi:hypothetical protein
VSIVRSHLLAVPALLPNRYFDHMRHISGRLRGRTNVNHVITILPVVRRGLLTTLTGPRAFICDVFDRLRRVVIGESNHTGPSKTRSLLAIGSFYSHYSRTPTPSHPIGPPIDMSQAPTPTVLVCTADLG